MTAVTASLDSWALALPAAGIVAVLRFKTPMPAAPAATSAAGVAL